MDARIVDLAARVITQASLRREKMTIWGFEVNRDFLVRRCVGLRVETVDLDLSGPGMAWSRSLDVEPVPRFHIGFEGILLVVHSQGG